MNGCCALNEWRILKQKEKSFFNEYNFHLSAFASAHTHAIAGSFNRFNGIQSEAQHSTQANKQAKFKKKREKKNNRELTEV